MQKRTSFGRLSRWNPNVALQAVLLPQMVVQPLPCGLGTQPTTACEPPRIGSGPVAIACWKRSWLRKAEWSYWWETKRESTEEVALWIGFPIEVSETFNGATEF